MPVGSERYIIAQQQELEWLRESELQIKGNYNRTNFL
jgi:hypothetical protein